MSIINVPSSITLLNQPVLSLSNVPLPKTFESNWSFFINFIGQGIVSYLKSDIVGSTVTSYLLGLFEGEMPKGYLHQKYSPSVFLHALSSLGDWFILSQNIYVLSSVRLQ